ncbi:MAG: GxxExxY protein [Chitinophagales bacterium]|jgi:GxxExxY protein|nr:GxxExxY protein [Sphingobacteriales bacterium]
MELLYKEEVYQIIGACMEVHKHLGHGFSEVVYKDALELEFAIRTIFFKREQEYEVEYKGMVLKHKFFADMVICDKIILELKAAATIDNVHIQQTLNYMKVSNCKVGLVVNFGKERLEYKRLIY